MDPNSITDDSGGTGASSGIPAGDEDIQLFVYTSKYIYGQLAIFLGTFGMYGFYMVICLLALYSIITRRVKTRSLWILLSLLVLTFLIVTSTTIVLGALAFIQYRVALIHDPTTPLSDRLDAMYSDPTLNRLYVTQFVLSGSWGLGIVFIIADALTIWRALTICGSPRYLSRCLYSLLFLTFVLSIVSNYYYVTLDIPEDTSKSVQTFTTAAGSILSNIVNIAATSMIIVKANQYRMFAQGSNIRLSSGNALMFLAESGVIYSIVQMTTLVLSLVAIYRPENDDPNLDPEDPFEMVWAIWRATGIMFSAAYTPAIILIVNYRCSLADSINTKGRMTTATGPVSNLVFASVNARNTTREINFTTSFTSSQAEDLEIQLESKGEPDVFRRVLDIRSY